MENTEVTEDSYQVRKLLPHLLVDRKRYFSDWRIPLVRRRSDDGCEVVLRSTERSRFPNGRRPVGREGTRRL
jgi:hypothetical protein